MNRTVLVLGASAAALCLAASAPLSATTTASDAAKHVPFSAKAPCKHGGTIFLKGFYDTGDDDPNQVRLRVRNLEPGARATITFALYQGDSGTATQGHARIGADGQYSEDLPGSQGFYRANAVVTTADERCRLEISGLVTPLP